MLVHVCTHILAGRYAAIPLHALVLGIMTPLLLEIMVSGFVFAINQPVINLPAFG